MVKQFLCTLVGVVALYMLTVFSANAAEGILFQCKLADGGTVVAARSGTDVNVKAVDNSNTVIADVSNPITETGLANIEKDKGGSIDSLDVLNDTVQYSVIVEHNGLANVSSFVVFSDTAKHAYLCDPTSVVNHLNSKRLTKGIFRP